MKQDKTKRNEETIMKKALSVTLAIVTLLAAIFAFASCGSSDTESTNDAAVETADNTATESDLAYIKEKGKLVVGITDFEPMDYQDADGNWIGFDADLATKFAEKLGVEVEFVEIDWDNKIMELNGKSIDCVWNGMTLTDEVKSSMATSDAYCNNAQIIVVPADKADSITSAEDCKDMTFAVESGSAGQEQAKANNFTITEVKDQATAVQEVASGTSDAAIIDSLMAGAMVGEGTGFSTLKATIKLNSEEYGVGFRKGSDVVDELNTFFAEMTADGSMKTLAEQYGVQDALIG